MNNGKLGTSNESRSALPAQFRNGFSIFASCWTASCKPATEQSTLPSADLNSCACGKTCGAGSAAPSLIFVSNHSPFARVKFCPSHSITGDSDESYLYVLGGSFFLNCACVPTSGRMGLSASGCLYGLAGFAFDFADLVPVARGIRSAPYRAG